MVEKQNENADGKEYSSLNGVIYLNKIRKKIKY